MMEQPDSGECHDNPVFIADFDDIVVTNGTAGLGNIPDTGFFCPLHIVAEGEEGVTAEGNSVKTCNPFSLFVFCKNGRFFGKKRLPGPICRDVLIFVCQVNIDRRIPCRAADVPEFQVKNLRMASQPPPVRFAARKPCAVDAALLACTDADGLAVLNITDRI